MTRLSSIDVNTLLDVIPRAVTVLQAEKASFSIKVTLADVVVHPAALEARLSLELSGAPRDTVIGSYLTRNGIGTNEGSHYVRKSGAFIFHPGGSTKQEIVIALKGNNAVGKTVEVVLSATVAGASIAKQIGRIMFSTEAQVPPPSGFSLVFESNFIHGFLVSDTGLLADGTPCWQSKPAHGRTQDGNSELGLYVDPALYPGTDPFPIVDGKRALRSEKLATPISYDGRLWNYTASMITSRKLRTASPGDRIECRLAMPVLGQRGAWPAFWLLSTTGYWPTDFKEIDMLEWPINAGHNGWTFYTTQHWAGGGHLMRSYPIDLRTLGIAEDLTGFHTYGVTIGQQDLRFDIDGYPTAIMENRNQASSWYVLLNMAMGGSWPGSPTPETEFPCDMILDWIRFYTPAA